MAATFFLRKNVHGAFELLVWLNTTGFADNHTTADLIFIDTTQQQTSIITGFTAVEELTEHFDTCDGGSDWLVFLFHHADDFYWVTNVDHTTLDTAGCNRTTTCDGEYVFHWHQERLVYFPYRLRNFGVAGAHQFVHFFHPVWIALKGFQSRTLNDFGVVAIESVRAQELAEFHVNEFKHFFVFHEVDLVHKHHNLWNAYLTGEQDVLTRLGHWAVCCSTNENGTVHLSGTRDHVFNIIGVTRAVHVSIVTGFRLIFHVCCVDGNTTLFFFRSSVNIRVVHLLSQTALRQYERDCRGQGRLTVVNVADRTDVHVRF